MNLPPCCYNQKMAYCMTQDDGREWLCALRDIPSKSSEDSLATWLEIVDDINERNAIVGRKKKVGAGTRLMRSIAHRVSDQATTEVKFNTLLETYVNDILPLIEAASAELEEEEEEMEEEDQRIVVRINNFFCGLHSLVHYADLADKAALEAETTFFGTKEDIPALNATFRKAGESGAARTVREVCKATSRGGNEQSGVYDKAVTYFTPILKEEFDAQSLPFTPYLRNRFSILFHNCSAIYCLYDHLVEFYTFHQSNQLLQSVLFNLKQPQFIKGIRAIAILSKKIMAPFFNKIEDRSVDLSEMAAFYAKLLQFFEDASQDPSILLYGDSPFEDKYLRKDKWWDKVFKPDPRFDADTLTVLGVILPAMAVYTKRNFADYLPGGKHANIQKEDVKGVPKHNKLCERVFGMWDYAKRHSPNKSEIVIEAKLCFSFNNTAEWLNSLDDESKRQIIQQSRKETAAVEAKFKERQDILRQKAEEAMKRKQDEAHQKEQQRLAEVDALREKVNDLGGVWKTEAQVDEALAKVKRGARGGKGKLVEAVKTQIAYRRKVYRQKLTDSKLWNFSENGHIFTHEELTTRLKLIISQKALE